jgi:hypothetical protein
MNVTTTMRTRSAWPIACCFKMRREMTREEAEAEAVAAMDESPLFGGVALRDLEREDRGKN